MNQEQEILERLRQIEAKENQRLLIGKIQLALAVILVIGLIAVFVILFPKAQSLYTEAVEAIAQTKSLMAETEGILTQVDWERFKELDVEGLNTAIANLNGAVETVESAIEKISQFFGQFSWN